MNTFTAVVNIAKDPETIQLGDKTLAKLRLADNTFGKQAETRFFDALFSGNDLDVCAKLKVGDQIVVSGTLKYGSYKAKKGKMKGQKIYTDEMPFAKILNVTRSPSFFAGADAPADEPDDAAAAEDPDGDDSSTSENPLADLMA